MTSQNWSRRGLMEGGVALGVTLAAPVAAASDVEGGVLEGRLARITDPVQTIDSLHRSVVGHLTTQRLRLREKARLWAEAFPRQVEALLDTAGNDVQGRLVLPGSLGSLIDVGDPPRWQDNPLGDQEYIAFLNRCAHWTRMVRAWLITGDDRYAQRVTTELDSWIADNPRPGLADIEAFRVFGPWRALEAGLRLEVAWPLILEAFVGTSWMPPERLARLFVCLHDHAELLRRVAPQLWPAANHNHYSTEMAGLLAVSAMAPELKDSRANGDFAWSELERCVLVQHTADGGQIEGSPHYHNVCVRTACRALLIGAETGRSPSEAVSARLRGALRYSAASFRPTGVTVPWADGDATPLGHEAGLWGGAALDDWTSAAATRPLASDRVRNDAASIVAWALPDLTRLLSPTLGGGDERLPLVHRDAGLDQWMARSSWSPEAASVFFGCHTPVENGHAHMDPASFDFTALGQALVVDPGRYTYREGDERRAFKSVGFHNTLSVDGREPFDYISSFELGPQGEGRLTDSFESSGLVAAEAINRNFAPIEHRRAIALVDDRVLLVLDHVTDASREAQLTFWFHLDSDQAEWNGWRRELRTHDADKANVRIAAADGRTGRTFPGRVSDVLDLARPSTRLALSAQPGGRPALFLTLIEPYRSADELQVRARPLRRRRDGAIATILTVGGIRRALVWLPGRSLSLHVST